jgi:hypothetical protein
VEILKRLNRSLNRRRHSCYRLSRSLVRRTSGSGSSSAKRSFGRQSGVDGVESGFVDDAFFEEALELLFTVSRVIQHK